MNVLSLFNGMSCGEIALREIGIVPDIYYSSEIDKYAIAQTQLNFPNTVQLGSVVDVDVSKLEPIGLLLGGSPCQSFSFAGKRKGMATKCEIKIVKLDQYLELKSQGFEFEGQSYLFWEYMRILTDIRKYNPSVKFLLENVEMGKIWEHILSDAIGIAGVHINSNLVSAQNRKRIYWTNIRVGSIGMFGDLYADIPLPKDEGILLRDILEEEVDEKYFISQAVLNRMDRKNYSQPQINPDETGTLSTKNNSGQMALDSGTTFVCPEKSFCIDANYHKGTSYEQYLKKHRRQLVPDVTCVAMRGRGENNTQQLEPNKTGKTNALMSVQKDNLVMLNKRQENNLRSTEEKANTFLSISWKGSQANGMTLVQGCDYRSDEGFRFRDNEKSGTLAARARNDESCGQLVSISTESNLNENQQAKFNPNIDSSTANALTLAMGRAGSSSEYMVAVSKVENITGRIRRLTPTECARLQTVPDWYVWQCSNTQQYKMLGNGWTIKVISHILNFLKQ